MSTFQQLIIRNAIIDEIHAISNLPSLLSLGNLDYAFNTYFRLAFR